MTCSLSCRDSVPCGVFSCQDLYCMYCFGPAWLLFLPGFIIPRNMRSEESLTCHFSAQFYRMSDLLDYFLSAKTGI